MRRLRFALLCLAAACGGNDTESAGEDTSSPDADQEVRALTMDAKLALCARTQPYADAMISIERECEESALTFATDFGEAPFDASVCKEVRTSCLDELRGYEDGYEEPPCRHLSWFGPSALATCDVTVAEFEACWKARADFHQSYSCERPGAYSEVKSEQVDECYARMSARCSSGDD